MPGAPIGNVNAVRHGLHTSRLPRGCGWLRNTLNRLRKDLEAATLEVHGAVDIEAAATILAAVDWTRHSLLCQRWLREAVDTMSAADRLYYSREISRCASERLKCVKALKLSEGSRILGMYDALRLPGLDGNETAEAG